MLAFPEGPVLTLPRLVSDHNPIMFCARNNHVINNKKEARPFPFGAAWLTHEVFDQLFNDNWLKSPHSLPDAIMAVTEGVKECKEKVFGNILAKKRKLVSRINGIQRAWN